MPDVDVEIVWAHPDRTVLIRVALAPGATVADAVNRAAQAPQFAKLDVRAAPVGIFGRIVHRDQLLKPGDRVELYRPLAADPKSARRKRVASKSGRF